jgi:hypothetical protein
VHGRTASVAFDANVESRGGIPSQSGCSRRHSEQRASYPANRSRTSCARRAYTSQRTQRFRNARARGQVAEGTASAASDWADVDVVAVRAKICPTQLVAVALNPLASELEGNWP